jgi:hypothetical protein
MLPQSVRSVHRWLGVLCCPFFLCWFLSGIGMLYFDFPEVTAADRTDHSRALDASAIHLSPEAALAAIGPSAQPQEVRLQMFDGRPAYRFRIDGRVRRVWADTGGEAVPSRGAALRTASFWTGLPPARATVRTIEVADQWTVEGPIQAQLPMWTCSWPDGERVYVSQMSGDVVQYTSSRLRVGAYLGPIPHWLYIAPLRRRAWLWRAVVIAAAAAGTIGAALGLMIGCSRFSPTRRYRRAGAPSRTPYTGRKRWHVILGLIFGTGAVTWAFSGLLSMAPERQTPRVRSSLLGPPRLDAFARLAPEAALRRLAGLDVRELQLASFDGKAVYLADLAGGATRIVTGDGDVRHQFDRSAIVALARRMAAPARLAATGIIDRYDAYYRDRRGRLPLPVLAVALDDAERTRLYVDPATARIAGSYDRSQWPGRWLYHGLHSLDFPWLAAHPAVWLSIVLVSMIGGAALSSTAALLAWRVVTRRASTARPS